MIAQQIARILILAIISFSISFLLVPLLLRLLDKVQARKQIRANDAAPIFSELHKKKAGTPTMGGIIIWVVVLILAALFSIGDQWFDSTFHFLNFIDRSQTYLPLAALAISAFFGLIDDVLGILKIGPKGGGLSISQKIVMYFFVALLGALWFYYKLGFDVLNIPFIGQVFVDGWYIPIFIFILVASAFSLNETDGLDGLAGGVSLFAFLALTGVAFILGKYHLAAFGSVVIGALLTFLWYNIYPARFFMGDTGSMSLGITLGIFAMLTKTELLLPFFMFIPVVESVSVIVQMISKKFRKKKVFLSTPIHHHFEALGWPETKITMRFWILSSVFSVLGVVLFFLSRYF